jgi:hypothetical protein
VAAFQNGLAWCPKLPAVVTFPSAKKKEEHPEATPSEVFALRRHLDFQIFTN